MYSLFMLYNIFRNTSIAERILSHPQPAITGIFVYASNSPFLSNYVFSEAVNWYNITFE